MTPMLEMSGVETFYGVKQVLFGIDLCVQPGEVVTLMGRNGMGKTTSIRSILGLTPAQRGDIRFNGISIRTWPSYRVAQAGIGLVPEGRQIFSRLTVRENLIATAARPRKDAVAWTLADIFRLFPKLAERQGNWGWQLSGGEQQMLAIGRALLTNPKLLILDEATEGIAPIIRQEIWQCLEFAKLQGQAILVVDKNLDALLRLANRHYILEKGLVVYSGSSEDLSANPDLYNRYLGVGGNNQTIPQ